MAPEIQPIQALVPGEAYLIEEFPPSIQPCIRSQLDSAKLSPVLGAPSTVLSPSPVNKMKALPQRPGPGGSRVTKKRPSIPHLGDGLLTVFSPKDTLAKRSVLSNMIIYSSFSLLNNYSHHDSLTRYRFLILW